MGCGLRPFMHPDEAGPLHQPDPLPWHTRSVLEDGDHGVRAGRGWVGGRWHRWGIALIENPREAARRLESLRRLEGHDTRGTSRPNSIRVTERHLPAVRSEDLDDETLAATTAAMPHASVARV